MTSPTDGMTIALAQIAAQKGDVEANIRTHLRMIDAACRHDTDCVIFPELSLTGYEPALAKELAFDLADRRLEPLLEACHQRQITVVAGAPISNVGNPILGSFVLFPNRTATVYSKRYLHPGEEVFFSPQEWNPLLVSKGEVASLAICADILNPLHARTAYENHSTLYLASVLITPGGYAHDTSALREYARKYSMTVMMANYCGFTGGYEAAGESIVIDTRGETVAALECGTEGILAVRRQHRHKWLEVGSCE